jgi:hypothetical protein
MLRDTPRKFLYGLHSVVLTNSSALSRKERDQKPGGRRREDVADKWSKKLANRFIRGRYWYLLPVAVLITLIVGVGKDVAKLYRKLRAQRVP